MRERPPIVSLPAGAPAPSWMTAERRMSAWIECSDCRTRNEYSRCPGCHRGAPVPRPRPSILKRLVARLRRPAPPTPFIH
jgi:hypothetical protein